MLASNTYSTLAEVYAFIGNSLLRPMTMTSPVGLDPSFWDAFPDFEDDGVRKAAQALSGWALDSDSDGMIDEVSYQYTKLFIGPPSPSAPPWETMYGGENGEEVTVAFGTPTFQMRQLLREIGLELSNENHQYEDHMGIELLYLSELCRRAAEGSEEERDDLSAQMRRFIEEHPLSWVGTLERKVDETFPDGYISLLLRLEQALLQWQMDQ